MLVSTDTLASSLTRSTHQPVKDSPMSVTVSITFSSLEEAIMNLAKLRGSDAKVEAAPAPKPEKPAKVEKPVASPSGATQAAAPATPDTAASGVPYDTVVKAI